MREVKVRGYAVDEMVNSQWMFGTGIHKNVFTNEYAAETGVKEEWFVFTESGWVHVYPQSIGRYTGLKDKNGIEIYEGDILVIPIGIRTEKFLHVIKWEKETASFVLEEVEEGNMTWYFDDLPYETGEVIGNIFKHPNLREVAQ